MNHPAAIVLDIDRDAGCCRVAFDENPSATWLRGECPGPRDVTIKKKENVGKK